MEVKKGAKNTIYAILGKFIALGLGIFIPRLVVVSYGSELNGFLSSVGTIISYLTLLEAGIGTAMCQSLYRPIHDNDKDGINKILTATNFYYKKISLIYFSLVVGIAFLYPLIINSNINYFLMVALILIHGIPGVVSFFFTRKYISLLETQGNAYLITNLNTIVTAFVSVAKIVMLYFNFNIIFIQILFCSSTLAQVLFVYFYVKRKLKWINVKSSEPNFDALKQKNSTLIHQICGMISSSTDTFILSIICGLEVASIYAVYNMIFSIIQAIYTSISGGFTFAIGQAYCDGTERYTKVIDTYETYYTAISSALLTTACVLIIPFLKLYMAGADINYINIYLPILFLLVDLFRALRNTPLLTINVSGNFRTTTKHAIIESIINLVVSIILVFTLGLPGVLIGTIVAFIYRTIVSTNFSNHKILKRKSTHTIKIVLIDLLLTIIICFVGNYFMIDIPSYLIFFIVAIIVTPIILLAFIMVNSLIDKRAYSSLKGLIKRKLKKA